MKKITSTAALGLRLTGGNALVVFATVGFIQGVQIWLAMKDGNPPAFESLWDGQPGFVGLFGLAALVIGLYGAVREKRIDYTLRRLRLPEGAVTAIWAVMFAGWFVLYWAFQTGVVLVSWRIWAKETVQGANYLFVTAHRTSYFHFLLPISEPWAVARNVVLCLAGGGFAALSGFSQRRERSAPLCMFLIAVFWWIILWPREMASQTDDITLMVVTILCLAIDLFWSWR